MELNAEGKITAHALNADAEEILYLDRECTQPYLDSVLAYIEENGEQLALEKDETYYFGALK